MMPSNYCYDTVTPQDCNRIVTILIKYLKKIKDVNKM